MKAPDSSTYMPIFREKVPAFAVYLREQGWDVDYPGNRLLKGGVILRAKNPNYPDGLAVLPEKDRTGRKTCRVVPENNMQMRFLSTLFRNYRKAEYRKAAANPDARIAGRTIPVRGNGELQDKLQFSSEYGRTILPAETLKPFEHFLRVQGFAILHGVRNNGHERVYEMAAWREKDGARIQVHRCSERSRLRGYARVVWDDYGLTESFLRAVSVIDP